MILRTLIYFALWSFSPVLNGLLKLCLKVNTAHWTWGQQLTKLVLFCLLMPIQCLWNAMHCLILPTKTACKSVHNRLVNSADSSLHYYLLRYATLLFMKKCMSYTYNKLTSTTVEQLQNINREFLNLNVPCKNDSQSMCFACLAACAIWVFQYLH